MAGDDKGDAEKRADGDAHGFVPLMIERMDGPGEVVLFGGAA
jgi:hypothetical protein